MTNQSAGLVSIKGSAASTMKDYDTLKTRMASVAPSSTAMSAYSPTNSPASCPELTKNWAVKGDALPPTPNTSLCSCMYSALSCVPDDSTKTSDYGDLFGYICSAAPSACAGISGNTTTGVYGAYSMCDAKQQLGYVLDQYYLSQKSASDACGFDGKAKLVSPSAASTCSSALSSASAANSVAATATSGSGSGGTSSSGTAQKSSNAAVPGGPRGAFALGELAVGLYVVVAMGLGAGMVLL